MGTRHERCEAAVAAMSSAAALRTGGAGQILGQPAPVTVAQTNAFSRDGHRGGGVLRARSGSEMEEVA